MKNYVAYGKRIGEHDWRIITFGGLPFFTTEDQINQLVASMRQKYPNIEYKIEEVV